MQPLPVEQVTVEVGRLAAYASWLELRTSSEHSVYKRTPCGFEVVRRDPGPPTPDNSILQDDDLQLSDAQRCSDFWLLRRHCGCQEATAFLMRVMQEAWGRGLRLCHEGKLVTNVFACNICHMDLSGLDSAGKTIRCASASADEGVEIGLYSSSCNVKKLAMLDCATQRLLGMWCPKEGDDPNREEFERHRSEIQDRLGQETDIERSVCPHWWVGCVLEDATMVHVDLCGVAYDAKTDVHELELLRGREDVAAPRVPATLVNCPALSVSDPAAILGLDATSHKLQLIALSSSSQRSKDLTSMSAYPDWRAFRFVQKRLPLMITPFDQFAQRRFGDIPEALSTEVVDFLILEVVQQVAATSRSIAVKLSGLSRPELNGQIGRVVGVHDGRVACKVAAAPEGIRVLPGRISAHPLPVPTSQALTLAQMRAALAEDLLAEFALDDRVELCGLVKCAELNGRHGEVVDIINGGFKTDTRIKVRLTPETRDALPEVKSVKAANLKLLTRLSNEEKKKQMGERLAAGGRAAQELMAYMQNDPVAKKYMMTMFAGNVGWLSQTDPEVRPALKRFAEGPFASMMGLPPSHQKDLQEVYALTQMPQFDEYHEIMVRAKTGIDPDFFHTQMAQPWFARLHERVAELGLTRQRAVRVEH